MPFLDPLTAEARRLQASIAGLMSAARGRRLTAQETARLARLETEAAANLQQRLGPLATSPSALEQHHQRTRAAASRAVLHPITVPAPVRPVPPAQTRAIASVAASASRPVRSAATRPVHLPLGPASREFSTIGEFLHAVRFRPNDQRLAWVEGRGEMRAELRMDDGPSGGFAIPPQFREGLLALGPQQAIIRPRATVIDAGNVPDAPVTQAALDQTGAAPGNWFGGVQVGWIGEGGIKPATDVKLREITWTPHEVAGTITVTDKLLRNWRAAGPLLGRQLQGAVAQAEDLAFLSGNGIGKPLGFLRSGALLRVSRQIANAVTYDDVVAMVTRLHGRGVFGYSRSMLGALMRLKDGQGRPLWLASSAVGQPATLFGLPAIENDRNPALGALGDLWCADLSRYVIKDGAGPFVAASPHVLFQQNKTVIKIFWNVDGAPWLTAPLTLENGDVASPFVALDVPAV